MFLHFTSFAAEEQPFRVHGVYRILALCYRMAPMFHWFWTKSETCHEYIHQATQYCHTTSNSPLVPSNAVMLPPRLFASP